MGMSHSRSRMAWPDPVAARTVLGGTTDGWLVGHPRQTRARWPHARPRCLQDQQSVLREPDQGPSAYQFPHVPPAFQSAKIES